MFDLAPYHDIGINGTPHISITISITDGIDKSCLQNVIYINLFITVFWIPCRGTGYYLTVIVEVGNIINNYPLGSNGFFNWFSCDIEVILDPGKKTSLFDHCSFISQAIGIKDELKQLVMAHIR